MSSIFTSVPKGWWLPFFFRTRSAIPGSIVSPLTKAFQCSASLTFKGQLGPPLYFLPKQQRMKYKQLLVMFYPVAGSTWLLYRVELLLNIVLILYGPQIFWIFSDNFLTKRQIASISWASSVTLLLPPADSDIILKSTLAANHLVLVYIWVATNDFCMVL